MYTCICEFLLGKYCWVLGNTYIQLYLVMPNNFQRWLKQSTLQQQDKNIPTDTHTFTKYCLLGYNFRQLLGIKRWLIVRFNLHFPA